MILQIQMYNVKRDIQFPVYIRSINVLNIKLTVMPMPHSLTAKDIKSGHIIISNTIIINIYIIPNRYSLLQIFNMDQRRNYRQYKKHELIRQGQLVSSLVGCTNKTKSDNINAQLTLFSFFPHLSLGE